MKKICESKGKSEENIIKYFKKYYIQSKNVYPERWLHMNSKRLIGYDATNNTAESLNNILKLLEYPKLSFMEAFTKLINNIDHYDKIVESLYSQDSWEYSEEASIHRKQLRDKKKNIKIDKMIKEYKLELY